MASALHPVDVWSVSLAEPCEDCLSHEEVQRAHRFKFDRDRIRWSRARSSLRLTLSKYASVTAERLAFAYGEHGKPALSGFPEIQFNISHAGDWALIAVTEGVPVGIDIERIRPQLDMRPLLARLGESDLPESQLELYKRWTLREARSKAAGGALFDPPAVNIRGITLDTPKGYAASVALVGCVPAPRYCVGKR